MDRLSLQNPVFAAYVVAASIIILKVQAMAWLTVWRMMRIKGGFRSPEDIRRTPLNPDPDPRQLGPDERVDRIRRIMQNDLESVPFFLVTGLLFVVTGPTLVVAQCLFYGYVATRLAHFVAYYIPFISYHEPRLTTFGQRFGRPAHSSSSTWQRKR